MNVLRNIAEAKIRENLQRAVRTREIHQMSPVSGSTPAQGAAGSLMSDATDETHSNAGSTRSPTFDVGPVAAPPEAQRPESMMFRPSNTGGQSPPESAASLEVSTGSLENEKRSFIRFVGSNVDWLKKRVAIMQFKYADLKFWNDAIMISCIGVSTALTCLETIKAELDLSTAENLNVRRTFALLPIFFSSYVAMAMSILRFKRLGEKLEEVTRVAERGVYVTGRLRRVQHDALSARTMAVLEGIKAAYSKDTFDIYVDVKSAIERAVGFTEVIKYKAQYARLVKWLEEEEALRNQAGAIDGPCDLELHAVVGGSTSAAVRQESWCRRLWKRACCCS